MRIWVDGQCFQTVSNVRGIGRYVADLLKTLGSIADVELIISLNANLEEETIAARSFLRQMAPRARIEVWYGLATSGELHSAYSSERMTEEHILAAHINQIQPDIALSPSPFEGAFDPASPFIHPARVNAATACVFHDAIPHFFHDQYLSDEGMRKLYRRRFEAISDFDVVLCNSRYTASQYRTIFGRDNDVAIGAGVAPAYLELLSTWRPDPESLGASLGRYVLYVGGVDWRKNLPLLLRALGRIPECLAGDLKLVIAGGNEEKFFEPFRALWSELNLPPANLVSTGWVSDAQLVDLYRNAAVAVQPSLMEGFGLTALEAMAAECPFLSARGSAVAEVVGSDEMLFDPYAPPQLASLISRVLHDRGFRERITSFGLERAKAFSWGQSAALALEAMRATVARTPRKAIATPPDKRSRIRRRLVMDVSATALSPVLTGIQRVMHCLSREMLELNVGGQENTVLSYCVDELGWYALPHLSKDSISLDPRNRLPFQDNDTYFLLDSSWAFTDGQRRRVIDALAMGQEVIHGIHDIGPLTMSAMTDAGMPPAFRKWFEFILGHSTGLVCVSRSVADEIVSLLEEIELPRPMKIGYFRLGADFADAAPDRDWLNFLAARPTFLMVGTIEPRKGHAIALEAFERLWADGIDVNLLIVGKAGWNTSLLQARLALHPEAERRLFVRDSVSDAQLQGAYRAATALVMASYLEGFGLPVVEAGRLGCPVVLSDIPVFREVGAGAPAARYFPRGDARALAAVVREVAERGFGEGSARADPWPTWAESAREVKHVLYGGDWYRRYEPKETLPNFRLSDIGKVRVTRALTPAERQHSLRYVEGPLLSNDGVELHFAVALRNESDVLWSSYGNDGAGLEIHLGSHIYARNGLCLDYENPRTQIPFVLYPGQEIYLPVRVSTDWFTRDAASLGVEVVQEGVAWFGEALRLSLLSPPVEVDNADGEASTLLPRLFRGPFGRDLANEQYFLFVVFNPSHRAVRSDDGNGLPRIAAHLLDETGARLGGCWIVNRFVVVAPGGFGFICIYASGGIARNARSLALEFDGDGQSQWRLDLATLDLVPSTTRADPRQVLAPLAKPSPELSASDNASASGSGSVVIPFRQTREGAGPRVATRGFHASEATHTWMGGRNGEIDLSACIPDVRRLRRLELTCASLRGFSEPTRLRVLLGERDLGVRIISTEFMTYGFDMSPAPADSQISAGDRLRLSASQSKVEEGGERNLSVAVSSITATLGD